MAKKAGKTGIQPNHRWRFTLVALPLAVLCLAEAPLCAEQFGLFSYGIVADTIEITGYPGTGTGAIEVPAAIGGRPVTRIGYDAFYGCSALTGISLPDSITQIRGFAFAGCSSLTSIALPAALTDIGTAAFESCSSLSAIEIPENVTTIGDSAFCNCHGLTAIQIPSKVADLGFAAFDRCSRLQTIDVDPANLVYSSLGGALYSADQSELYKCPEGRTGAFTIPTTATQIDQEAFTNCSGLDALIVEPGNPQYHDIDGVLFSFGGLLLERCPEGRAGSYSIPPGVEIISLLAFHNCGLLTSVSIPESVSGLSTELFAPFQNCPALASIEVDPQPPFHRYRRRRLQYRTLDDHPLPAWQIWDL